ncbi:MAG: hypothetical protein K6E90_05605, partial [Lachnospiraceae bacterium]|nr:hypothetical protein [Lachnospiraceae bacterium]
YMADNSDLYRKESLDSIASPEEMNDYIKVTGPSIWILLGAVIVFLAGVIIWSSLGSLKTTKESMALVEGGLAVCYVDKATFDDLDPDSVIRVGGELRDIVSASSTPVESFSVYDAGILADLGYSDHDPLYALTATTTLPKGTYPAEVIVEQIHPMSFVMRSE